MTTPSAPRSAAVLGSAVGDLLLGARCWGCQEAWWGVCPACRATLEGREPSPTAPDPEPEGFPPCVASSVYDLLTQGLITGHKEEQALGLTGLLGSRLALAVVALLELTAWPGGVVLVPVPSARATIRARGFDATTAMTRRAARCLRRSPTGPSEVAVAGLLRQSRAVADQAGLGARERAANLRGAFVVIGDRGRRPGSARSSGLSWRLPAGTAAVLVDDVVTTGSSLAEAARALAEARLPLLGAATVAATERNRSRAEDPAVRQLRTR